MISKSEQRASRPRFQKLIPMLFSIQSPKPFWGFSSWKWTGEDKRTGILSRYLLSYRHTLLCPQPTVWHQHFICISLWGPSVVVTQDKGCELIGSCPRSTGKKAFTISPSSMSDQCVSINASDGTKPWWPEWGQLPSRDWNHIFIYIITFPQLGFLQAFDLLGYTTYLDRILELLYFSSKTRKELDKFVIKIFTYSVDTSGLKVKLLDVHSMEDNL